MSLYGWDDEKRKLQFAEDQIDTLARCLEPLQLGAIEKRRLVSVLEHLFPALHYRINKPDAKKDNAIFIDTKKMAIERRIGASLIHLDRYFSYRMDIDAANAIRASLAATMKTYFSEADDKKRQHILRDMTPSESDSDDEEQFYSLLFEYVENMPHKSPERRIVLRDALRMYCQNTGYIIQDKKRTLIRIMSTIDTYVRSEDFEYIFEEIEKYISHPSSALRILLYMNPDRSNNMSSLR